MRKPQAEKAEKTLKKSKTVRKSIRKNIFYIPEKVNEDIEALCEESGLPELGFPEL